MEQTDSSQRGGQGGLYLYNLWTQTTVWRWPKGKGGLGLDGEGSKGGGKETSAIVPTKK